MLVYGIKRLGVALAIVVAAMIVLFIMIYVIPGDPVTVALGPRATPQMIESFRARMGLDQPLVVQLYNFFANVLQGDLGRDVLSNRSVSLVIMEQLPFTLALIAGAMTWSILIGIPLGCYAAIRQGTWIDHLMGVLSVSTIAIPSFVVAIYSMLAFSVKLGWFPAIGAGDRGDILDQLHHLVLPSLAAGLGWVGYIARMVRASMLEVMGENHIKMARAFGLPERMITFRYALKLAILPTLTLLGIGIGSMLSSAVFAEIVFSRPGIGKLVYDSVIVRNFPIVTGTVLVTTVFYVLATLFTDLLVATLDPRVRQSLR
ncbi:peptide/nickel transport system permease protein [Rhodoligotrophos appendicifer]|uniref:ABC transporter permease n=1 Tax=Rhodoligotrophos appendicifer TaxID=987056 RepID=UPI00118722DE|nr:ABC transporter permease [Rhodoligotrophos appendicifer]